MLVWIIHICTKLQCLIVFKSHCCKIGLKYFCLIYHWLHTATSTRKPVTTLIQKEKCQLMAIFHLNVKKGQLASMTSSAQDHEHHNPSKAPFVKQLHEDLNRTNCLSALCEGIPHLSEH